ncbi:hypothetical protein [Roseiflexus sp.]|uniref:hypothetical protein n=1 Tax=Roseiflexus sp. TaxID=2562120 RepID=UPI00398BAA99
MMNPDGRDSLIDALMRALDATHATTIAVASYRASTDDGSRASDPSLLSIEHLEAVIALLASAPTIVAATPPGVTKGRIAALLAPEERRHAGLLMEWLDRAGVLVEPRSEALRWREPRPFCSNDIAWITAQVRSVRLEAP